MTAKTNLRAGKLATNYNEARMVRTGLKAGGLPLNHSESLRVRSTIMAGGVDGQHNETLERVSDRAAVSMRRELVTASRNEDRLELLVVRAGLRAGRRARR